MYYVFKEVYKFLKAYYRKYSRITNILITISGINIFGFLVAFIICLIILVGIIVPYFLISMIYFNFKYYKRTISKVKCFGIQSGNPSDTDPYVITFIPLSLCLVIKYRDRVKNFFLIIPKTSEYGIDIPYLPPYLNYYKKESKYYYDYIILKGTRKRTQIIKDTIRVNLTTIVPNVTSKITFYYLIGESLMKFKKKMKFLDEEKLILRE